MEVEKEIEFLRDEVKSIKRQVYDNKDTITTLSIESRMLQMTLNKLESSITKLVDKMDAYITKQNEEDKQEVKERLTNSEKVIWALKTTALTLISSFLVLVLKEYFF